MFDSASDKPYKLSRTKLQLFLRCPRCFYLDRRLGIGQPQGPAFTLNSAVDALLKKEFNQHREAREPHPLMKESAINAVPFPHPELDAWRDNFHGVQYLHEPTNLVVTGAVDDVWVDGWVENAIVAAHACLCGGAAPEPSAGCEWCSYRRAAAEVGGL